jgi:hypothetical protein
VRRKPVAVFAPARRDPTIWIDSPRLSSARSRCLSPKIPQCPSCLPQKKNKPVKGQQDGRGGLSEAIANNIRTTNMHSFVECTFSSLRFSFVRASAAWSTPTGFTSLSWFRACCLLSFDERASPTIFTENLVVLESRPVDRSTQCE